MTPESRPAWPETPDQNDTARATGHSCQGGDFIQKLVVNDSLSFQAGGDLLDLLLYMRPALLVVGQYMAARRELGGIIGRRLQRQRTVAMKAVTACFSS